MYTEFTDDASRPRPSADSAGAETSAPRADRFQRWFKDGTTLMAYLQRQTCLLCSQRRRLFIEHKGAEICYLCYEEAGFDFARALAAKGI